MTVRYSSLLLAILSASISAEPSSTTEPSESTAFFPLQNGHLYMGARAGWAAYQDSCASNAIECDDDTFGYGLYAGYQFNNWFALEAGITDYGKPSATYSSPIDNSQSVSADTYGAELAAKLSYQLSSRWALFTRLGASYQDIDKTSDWQSTQSSQEWNTMVSAGVDYRLSQRWSLRGEYQFIDGLGDSTVDQADLHFTSIGLTYHFGQEAVVVEEEVVEAPTPVVIPEPVIVKETVMLSADAQFDFDSARLKANADLPALASQLNQLEVEGVTIIGHTDSVGSEAYNQVLSEKRAQAVADYLVEKGIPKERLTVEGKGERQPIADNATPEGRVLNRRVEIEFETVKETVTESTEKL